MPRTRTCTAGPKAREVKGKAKEVLAALDMARRLVERFHQQNDLNDDDLTTLSTVRLQVMQVNKTLRQAIGVGSVYEVYAK